MKFAHALLVPALVLAPLAGCLVVADDGHRDERDDYGAVERPSAVYTTIDADNQLSTDLGVGAGLFIEYASGGTWTIWTSCDTELTGSVCTWDVQVRTRNAALSGVTEIDLEGVDQLELYGSDQLVFFAETAYQSDGVQFQTPPGELLEIDVLLDGEDGAQYLVWYGNGQVHEGASVSPVVFQPDLP